MKDRIVFDVEIQHCIGEVVDGRPLTWNDTDKLGVSVGVVYEYQTDRFRVYGPGDVPALRSRIEACDEFVTFNGFRFDLPVIYGLPGRERVEFLKPKSNDILQRIWKSLGLDEDAFSDLHKGWGLDVVCKGTLGIGKSGYGGDAPKWFQEGNWGRLVDYCLDDVRLERDLGAFIDRYGFVVNGNTGKMLRITG